MADKMKADKISAARKKLKQFQSKTKVETGKSTVNNNDPMPFEQNVNTNSVTNELVANEIPPSSNINIIESIQHSAIETTRLPTSANVATFQPTEAVNVDAAADVRFHPSNQWNSTGANASTTNDVIGNDGNSAEQRIHDLTSLWQVEKLRNQELSVKVTQQHAEIEKLRHEVNTRNDADSNIAATVDKLRHDLSAHVQTVNVLVDEKADLMAKLMRCQQQVAEFESANIELQGRLNASRHRVNDLEKDLSTLEKSHLKYDGSQQALCTELETLQDENRQLKRSKQEACDETAEVHNQLQLERKEVEELKATLDVRNKELDMARVRLEQMTAGDLIRTDVSEVHDSQTDQQKLDAERQIIELQNMISELTGDRDRTQQQYQTYVQHLTKESSTQQQRIQELTKSNEKLTKREQSLVQHISELERQFQKQISTQQRLAALRDEEPSADASKQSTTNNAGANDQINALQSKLAALEKERNDLNILIEDHSNQNQFLRQQVLQNETKITELETNLERLRTETPNTTDILATIESDKVAASRAVAQNQTLKQQLDEIQNAYVQVSNDKLELTNRLQSEQHLAREINHRFGDVEKELTTVKQKLHFKDEEMIRLAHETTELNKQNLQLSQEVDSLRHYDATSNEKTTNSLHQQLAAAKQEIRRLSAAVKHQQVKCDTNESQIGTTVSSPLQQQPADSSAINSSENDECKPSGELNENHSCDGHDTHNHAEHHSHDHHHHDHGNNNVCGGGGGGHNHHDDQTTKDSSDVVSVCSTINIATNEAMEKLQDRFRRTMNEIADLTEEKQRLEHLVLQLQSETETIGEYIALYQTQRRLLKQRELEKDIQLHRIAADRAEMKDKLKQLNGLVELLLIQKGVTNPREIMESLNKTTSSNENGEDAINDESENKTEVDAKGTDGQTNILQQHHEHQQHDCSAHGHEHAHDHNTNGGELLHSNNTHETATKIINLLSEIKEKNLNPDYTSLPTSIHHCSCCSGKLEIV